MKFVAQHLNKHHLFHAPHKWFLALLVSPLHAAELHYQNKYHLNFRHAKKLFFFDMSLLAFIVFLFGATIFWHLYDPTVRSLVSLSVEQSTERIKTGNTIRYQVSYMNRSDVALVSPLLSVEFPAGFILSTSTSDKNFNPENSSLSLETLAPGANGSFVLEGTLLGTPDEHYDIIVRLSYIQEGEQDREHVVARIISAPRDTPLLVDWEMGDFVLSEGAIPFSIHIGNTASQALQNITLPLRQSNEIQYQNIKTTTGEYRENIWTIPLLLPNTSTTLQGNFVTKFSSARNTSIEILPTLNANNTNFPQKKITKLLSIISPTLETSATWKKETLTAKPLEKVPLTVTIKNTNAYTLEDLSVIIPLATGVDKVRLAPNALVRKISSLKSGEQVELDIIIPLSAYHSGTDVTLQLSPEVEAHVPLVPGAIYREKIQINPLKISTALTVSAELRYYTDEGDQLGRGPLPPRVGNETKYFATLVLSNTTGQAENVTMSAILPPGVEWGDKTSVTFGNDVTYNPANRKVSWSAPLVPAHTSIGISFALAFTPTSAMIGKIIPTLQSITVSGADVFTKLPLSSTARSLDTSLPNDTLAQNKGVLVEE